MATIGVCLETVFTSLPVEERIRRIAAIGYQAVEFWHPEGTWNGHAVDLHVAKDAASLRQACQVLGIELTDFAMHAWDGSIGGCPVNPADRSQYLEQIRKAIEFGRAAGCHKGITLSGTVVPGRTRAQMRQSLEEALGEAAEIARQNAFVLLLEPLNTRVDHGGYYLDTFAEAVEIARTINSPNLRLLYDVYHMQIMEGNVLATIENNLEWIGHFHAAGVPGRAELFDNELDYRTIYRRIVAMGYEGGFGLEYFPKNTDHAQSLQQNLDLLRGGL
jgi:hydroxypyruvate isomerase